jgi:hypothetical protein
MGRVDTEGRCRNSSPTSPAIWQLTLARPRTATFLALLAPQIGAEVTAGGTEYAAPFAIVTLPLGVLKAKTVKFTPKLPGAKANAIAKLGMGTLNKVVLQFPPASSWPDGNWFERMPLQVSWQGCGSPLCAGPTPHVILGVRKARRRRGARAACLDLAAFSQQQQGVPAKRRRWSPAVTFPASTCSCSRHQLLLIQLPVAKSKP